MLKKCLFGFPNVQWLHLTGEMDKSLSCSCQIFSGFYVTKIIKIGQFLTELFKKLKVDVLGTEGMYNNKSLADIQNGKRQIQAKICDLKTKSNH